MKARRLATPIIFAGFATSEMRTHNIRFKFGIPGVAHIGHLGKAIKYPPPGIICNGQCKSKDFKRFVFGFFHYCENIACLAFFFAFWRFFTHRCLRRSNLLSTEISFFNCKGRFIVPALHYVTIFLFSIFNSSFFATSVAILRRPLQDKSSWFYFFSTL